MLLHHEWYWIWVWGCRVVGFVNYNFVSRCCCALGAACGEKVWPSAAPGRYCLGDCRIVALSLCITVASKLLIETTAASLLHRTSHQ